MSTANKAAWIIIAVLFLFSAFLIVPHFHDDLKNRVDCALCQSVLALSSGAKQEFIFLTPPQLLQLSFVPEVLTGESFTFVFSIDVPRAPPV